MADSDGPGLRRRLAPALLAALLVAGALVQSAAAKGPSAGPKSYLPTAAPIVVPLPAAATATVQITLTNCGVCDGARTSTQAFGSAQIRFRTTAPLGSAALTPPRAGWTLTSTADATSGVTTVELGNTGIGTTAAVQPGDAVTVTFPVLSSATAGQVPFATQVKQSNDFSGEGNDFLRAAADPVVHLGSGPARTLDVVRQPTTIQGSDESAGTGSQAVLTTCVTVRALDQLGNLATSFTGSVTLTPSDATMGLKLGGSTTVAASAVAGVATFGSGTGCAGGLSATKLGFGYTLTAGSTGLTSDVSDPFDVLQFYALCSGSCATPKRTAGETTSSAVATSESPTDPHPFTFLVGQGTWEYADTCNPDVGAEGTNPYRSQVTVDLNEHDKTVTLLWTRKAVQWAINNGASQWRVCIATTYPFAVVGGSATEVGDTGWYVGALLPCGHAALGLTDPCLQKLNKSGGQQQAVVYIPQRPGDPKII